MTTSKKTTTNRTTRRVRLGGWFSLALCLVLTFAAIASWDSRANGQDASAPVGFAESATDQNDPGRYRIVANGVVEDGATGIRRNVPGIQMGQASEQALATLDQFDEPVDLRNDLRDGLGPRPVRLRMDAIDVDTEVLPIGLDQHRALVVPKRSDITGWWSGGSVPGESGPTVIVGHFDSKSAAGVFERLKDAKAGDRVVVEQSDGSAFVYRVQLVERLSKSAFPSEKVYGPTSASTLRLVTCGGKFDRSTGHYVDNTIVYADLLSVSDGPEDAFPMKISPVLGMVPIANVVPSTTTTATTTSTVTTTAAPTTAAPTTDAAAAVPTTATVPTVPSVPTTSTVVAASSPPVVAIEPALASAPPTTPDPQPSATAPAPPTPSPSVPSA